MIACLALQPYAPKGFFEWVKGTLLGPQVWSRFDEAFGVRYLLVTVSRCRDISAAWDRIEAALPEDVECLICPESVTPPDFLTPPTPVRFERMLLLETACTLVAGSRIPVNRRTVGLYDLEGAYCDLLPRLLGQCASVQVRTANLPYYRKAAERMLEEMGAPVLASEDASFRDCVLLICPDSCVLPIEPHCPVLSMHGRPGRLALSEPRIANSGGIPEGIDAHTLAGAVFELARSQVVRPVVASVMLGGRRVSVEQAGALLNRESESLIVRNTCF